MNKYRIEARVTAKIAIEIFAENKDAAMAQAMESSCDLPDNPSELFSGLQSNEFVLVGGGYDEINDYDVAEVTENAEVVSNCCSSSFHTDNDKDFLCLECHEYCDLMECE